MLIRMMGGRELNRWVGARDERKEMDVKRKLWREKYIKIYIEILIYIQRDKKD